MEKGGRTRNDSIFLPSFIKACPVLDMGSSLRRGAPPLSTISPFPNNESMSIENIRFGKGARG
jgi:hypothetical protein